ncbi:MAG: M20/M25/M40 family metallo-hydrolase [Patescibacteria group bacterium]
MNTLYETLVRDLVAFKSISTSAVYKDECLKAATYLRTLFTEKGFTAGFLEGKNSNPVVYARYTVDEKAPTIMVYGHYDVQPAEQPEWQGDAFTVREEKGRLYARGIMDNKGQFLVHVASILDLIERKELAYNILFLIEGDEESGSPDITTLLTAHKKELACDAVLVSDGELAGEKPMFEATFRAAANIRIQLSTAPNDVHSGIFGGALPNPLHELARIVGTLHDKENRITVPGMYDGIAKVTASQKKDAGLVINDAVAKKVAGVKALRTLRGTSFAVQTGFFPSIECSGIQGGYTGEGFQNIIPHTAEARLNVRIAPGQKTKVVVGKVLAHLKKQVAPWAKLTTTVEMHGDPILVDMNTPLYACAEKILRRVYKHAPMRNFEGASIPIIGELQRILKVPVLAIGLANRDSNIHGANENFRIDLIKKGLLFSQGFFSNKV